MSEPIMASDYLRYNGTIIERARRIGRSLTGVEQNIILSGRRIAADKGLSKIQVNAYEMEGERDREAVKAPIRVRAVFAFYHDPYEDIPACASYFIRESNHPSLPERGNVGPEDLLSNGVAIPLTPTYETWVKGGRKCLRS